MSLCDDCFKAVRHEGTPTGTEEKIGGVPCYVGTPAGEYAKDTAVLFLPDAFGMELINNQLLVDDFALNGYKTVGVDYFLGDGAPVTAFDPGSTFDRATWFGKHGLDKTRPMIDAVIAALKAQGVTKFGAVGYCYGAKPSVDLANENAISAAVLTHPSLLDLPGDFEKLLASSKVPLQINSCEFDPVFPPDAQKATNDLLDGTYAPGYEHTYWPGCAHGFAVRGDMSDPNVKTGKEGAFKATVDFYKKHL